MSRIDLILNALNGVKEITPGERYTALCPVHDDKKPSMGITLKPDGFIVMHCFACHANGLDVVNTLGLDQGLIFPESSEYTPSYESKFKKKHPFTYEQALSVMEHEINIILKINGMKKIKQTHRKRCKKAAKRIIIINDVLRLKS